MKPLPRATRHHAGVELAGVIPQSDDELLVTNATVAVLSACRLMLALLMRVPLTS